jgi:hypothetical protein
MFGNLAHPCHKYVLKRKFSLVLEYRVMTTYCYRDWKKCSTHSILETSCIQAVSFSNQPFNLRHVSGRRRFGRGGLAFHRARHRHDCNELLLLLPLLLCRCHASNVTGYVVPRRSTFQRLLLRHNFQTRLGPTHPLI